MPDETTKPADTPTTTPPAPKADAPKPPPAAPKEPNRKAIGGAARILADQTGTTVAAAAESIRREPALLDKVIAELQQLKADLT